MEVASQQIDGLASKPGAVTLRPILASCQMYKFAMPKLKPSIVSAPVRRWTLRIVDIMETSHAMPQLSAESCHPTRQRRDECRRKAAALSA
jgi:hypothetical protein